MRTSLAVSAHAFHVHAIDEAGDIAALVAMYAALGAEARSGVLAQAVEAMARLQLAERGRRAVTEDDADEWVARLADETFPHGDAAADLWLHARGVEPSARDALFPDGLSQVVRAASDLVWDHADSFYCGYTTIRSTTDAPEVPPEAAVVLGIQVPTTGFEHWEGDDDGWVLDTDAWAAEVKRRCIAACASMIHRWRRAFYARVLAKESQPDMAQQ